MEIKKKIGKRIANARKKIGLSKVVLSEKSGFGVSRLGNWEAGIRTPKLVDVKVLEEILGVSSSYLLCLVDNEDEGTNLSPENCFQSIPLFNESEITTLSNQSLISAMNAVEKLPLPAFCEQILAHQPFALRVFDNSMSPLYTKGNIVVFLQGVEAKHNDIVLVTLPGLQTPILRKYFIDSSNIETIITKLIPLNPEWVTTTVKNSSAMVIHGVASQLETVYF